MANQGDWRDGLESTFEMNKFMLDHAVNADCKFRVGPEGGDQESQVFQCHKTILSRYSPTFERMFFGSLPETAEEIRVPDIQPEIFKLMLTYIYTEEITFSNVQEACEVALAADKYMLSLLKEEIADYLCRCVDSSNVLQILHTADAVHLLNIEELKHACVNILIRHTKLVINQKDFKLSPESTLLLILQQDTLSCEEYELVMAVERWAEHQVAVSELPDNDVSIRKCLEPLIPHMRFKAMSELEFENGPGQSNWLTEAEKKYILTPESMQSDTLEKNTNNIISNEKERNFYSCIDYEPILDNKYLFPDLDPKNCNCKRTKFQMTFENTIPDHVLVGLQMFSKVKTPALVNMYPDKFKADTDCYEEDILVEIFVTENCSKTFCLHTCSSTQYIRRDVRYNSIFNIILEEPIYMKKGKYLIQISCDEPGFYPVKQRNCMMNDCPIYEKPYRFKMIEPVHMELSPIASFIVADLLTFNSSQDFQVHHLKRRLSYLTSI